MTQFIRSLQNERIKKAVRLRERRGRQQQGRIIIDGCREALRALEAGVEPLELFLCEATQHAAEQRAVVRALPRGQPEPIVTTEEVFAKVAYGDRSTGVVLVAAQPHPQLADLSLPADALVCVLEAVEKPGNIGAVLRSADAAGIHGVIVADGGTDLFNPNVIRASLGAAFSVPFCAATAPEVLQWLRNGQFTILAARVDAAVLYTEFDYRHRTAILLGSEALGLSDQWRGEDMLPVALPMLGTVDSLNVSVTAAVMFYEALRQRQRHTRPAI